MAYSVTEAAFSGFRLMGKRPLSVVAWVLFYSVLVVLPGIALLGAAKPELLDMLKNLEGMKHLSPEQGPAAAQTMMTSYAHMATHLGPMASLLGLWAAIIGAILNAAIFRAVLEPGAGSAAYLRAGGDEVRVFFIKIIMAIVIGVFWVALILGCAALMAALTQVQEPYSGILAVILVIAALLLFFYVPLRLSLAAPITFAEKRFAIFDSWKVTGGHTLALLGTVVMVVIFYMVISWIGKALGGLAFFANGFSGLDALAATGGNPMERLSGVLTSMTPVIIIAILVRGVVGVLGTVVFQSAFAEAYREFSGKSH